MESSWRSMDTPERSFAWISPIGRRSSSTQSRTGPGEGGMAWGPRLPNGNATLVMVSDDNFNASQVTLFLAFEVVDQ